MSWRDKLEAVPADESTRDIPVKAKSAKSSPQSREKTSEALSSLLGLARGATAGFHRELGAPLYSAAMGVPLDKARADIDQIYSQSESDNPGLTAIGRAVGGGAAAGAIPGNPVATGAILGGLTPIGESNDRSNSVDEALTGAALGAAGGAAAKYSPQILAAGKGAIKAAISPVDTLRALLSRGVPGAAAEVSPAINSAKSFYGKPEIAGTMPEGLSPVDVVRAAGGRGKNTSVSDLMDIGADDAGSSIPRRVSEKLYPDPDAPHEMGPKLDYFEKKLAARTAAENAKNKEVDAIIQNLQNTPSKSSGAATLITKAATKDPVAGGAAHEVRMSRDPQYRADYNRMAEKNPIFEPTRPTKETQERAQRAMRIFEETK